MATKKDKASGEHYRGDEAFAHLPKLTEHKRRPTVVVYKQRQVEAQRARIPKRRRSGLEDTQRSGDMLVHKQRWIYL